MDKKPTITYIIPIISDIFISRMLYTLWKYSEPDTFRVILIDQCKDKVRPEVWDYIKDKVHLYLHPSRNLGYAKASNEGIIHALHWKTPYICVSNDDVEIIDPRWLDGIWETFKKDPERILGVVPSSPRVAGWGYGVAHNPEVLPYKKEYTKEDYDYLLKGDFSDKKSILPKTFPLKIKGTVIDGAPFVMPYFKREAFELIGLFDEHFFPGCFLPEERVLMGDLKYKAIKDIKVGDMVIGKSGKKCSVTKVMPKDYKGEVLELSFTGTNEKVYVTPDHKVFARSKTGGKGKRSVCWSRNKNGIEEVEVKNLQVKDLVYCPIPDTDLNRLYHLPENLTKTPRNEVFEKDKKIFYPIKGIKRMDYEGKVYDLEVANDHSYIVEIMTSHNSGEDYDWNARAYGQNYRFVNTSYSWVWHHWSKSKDLFASGYLEDPYYKPLHLPYWNNFGDLYPPELNEGADFDVWGKRTDKDGNKVPLVRVPEIHVEQI